MFHVGIDLIVGLGSLVVILDYFGIKPKQPLWGLMRPLSRNWKLGIMLCLVALSLGMSGYGFYRAIRPKIVEKIVEKPVDRVVEKLVPQECPQPTKTTRSKSKDGSVIPPGTTITATTNAPDSTAVGVNTGTVTVNPPLNPYAPVQTYDFNGAKRRSLPGQISMSVGEELTVFQNIIQLQTAMDWSRLRDVCEAQIVKTPDWLTPYLFAGVAYANLGESTKAIERLTYVKKKAGGNPDYADADRILNKLQPTQP